MTSEDTRQPNIILAMCDDLGYGDVGFNGGTHIHTPHLDALAGEAVRFTRFYAGGPVCSPTRGTCLTGRHYIRYGVNHANRGRLPLQEISLPRICRGAGYATGHFGKWHLGTLTVDEPDSNRGGPEHPREYSPPWLHGFETCFSTEAKVPTWDPMVAPEEIGAHGPKWGTPGSPFGTHYWNERGEKVLDGLDGCDSAAIMDRAEAFIREASRRDQPFLAVIWFHAPHTPVVAGPRWRGMYPSDLRAMIAISPGFGGTYPKTTYPISLGHAETNVPLHDEHDEHDAHHFRYNSLHSATVESAPTKAMTCSLDGPFVQARPLKRIP